MHETLCRVAKCIGTKKIGERVAVLLKLADRKEKDACISCKEEMEKAIQKSNEVRGRKIPRELCKHVLNRNKENDGG